MHLIILFYYYYLSLNVKHNMLELQVQGYLMDPASG